MSGDFLDIVLLAALPVAELRVALPLALTVYAMPVWQAFLASVIGNALPVFFVFALFPPLLRFAETHWHGLHEILERYLRHLDRTHRSRYDRWGSVALLVFVAVPFPGTGVWTAAMLAILFNIKKRYSIPAILVGMMLAGLLVLWLTKVGIKLIG